MNSDRAKAAFNRLQAEGCDLREVLLYLDWYCTRGISPIQKNKKNKKNKRSALVAAERTAEQLLRFGLASKLTTLTNAVEPCGSLVLKRQFPKLDNVRPETLAAGLEAAIVAMRNEAKSRRKKKTTRALRTLVKVWLASYVEGCTGRRHCSEIAYLIETYYAMQGIHRDVSSAAVRKQIVRFQKPHSLAYRCLLDFAAGRFGELGSRPLLSE